MWPQSYHSSLARIYPTQRALICDSLPDLEAFAQLALAFFRCQVPLCVPYQPLLFDTPEQAPVSFRKEDCRYAHVSA